MPKPANVDAYIDAFPAASRAALRRIRQAIQKAAPKALEKISYGMPAIEQDGIVVWYGAHKEHIGFYHRASAIQRFQKELACYRCSKGAVQLPLSEVPIALVQKIVRYHVRENAAP